MKTSTKLIIAGLLMAAGHNVPAQDYYGLGYQIGRMTSGHAGDVGSWRSYDNYLTHGWPHKAPHVVPHIKGHMHSDPHPDALAYPFYLEDQGYMEY